jgi:abhydrolase domain-containing protein 17
MLLKRWLTQKPSWQLLWRMPLVAYLTLAGYAYFFSDRQIFLPRYATNAPLPVPPIMLQTADKGQVSAVYLANPQAKYTVLYSHGNGETLGDIYADLITLQKLNFNVLAYDYRGYGLSPGQASVANSYQDVEAAYDYLINILKVPADRIIIFGRSVGSGPSTYLASRRSSAGLILESAFTSTFRVVIPVKILPFDKFPNQDHLAKIRVPILLIHGTDDQVIPFSHGESLYATAQEPKMFLAIAGADHNDVRAVGGNAYIKAIQDFATGLR